MMNLFTAQEQLRDLSKGQLVQEMQSPSGSIPPFLIMTELQRRTRMESAAALDKGPPQTTVMQDTVNAAGVPQGGLATMAQAMAPQTSMAQNDSAVAQQGQPAPQAAPAAAPAPVQQMQEGGLAGISRNVSDYKAVLNDPAFSTLATRAGMTPEDYYASISNAAQAQNRARVSRNRFQALEPQGDGMNFPTQRDLDQRYAEDTYGLGRELPDIAPDATNDVFTPGGTRDSTVSTNSPLGLPIDVRDALALEREPVDMPPSLMDTAIDRELMNALALGRAPVDMSGGPGFRPGSPARAPVDMSGGPGFRDETAIDLARMNAQRSSEVNPYRPTVDMSGTPSFRRERFTATADPYAGYYADSVPEPGDPLPFQDTADALSALLAPKESTGLYGAPTADGIDPLGPNIVEAATPVTDPSVPDVADPLAPVRPAGPAGLVGASAPPPVTAEDRMFEQDKWLALARFGAALAASKAPTFGQAMGEAGQVGLDALGAARADYQKRKQDAEIMAMKRAAARGGGGGGLKGLADFTANQARQLEVIDNEIAKIEQEALGGYTPGVFGTMMGYEAEKLDPNTQRMLDRLRMQRQYIMNNIVAPVGTALAPTAGGNYNAVAPDATKN
jgi:hypothetical protein